MLDCLQYFPVYIAIPRLLNKQGAICFGGLLEYSLFYPSPILPILLLYGLVSNYKVNLILPRGLVKGVVLQNYHIFPILATLSLLPHLF